LEVEEEAPYTITSEIYIYSSFNAIEFDHVNSSTNQY